MAPSPSVGGERQRPSPLSACSSAPAAPTGAAAAPAPKARGGAGGACVGRRGFAGGGGDEENGATVAEIAGKHGKVTCHGNATLREAAALLVATGRTAATVVDDRGLVTGAFTENDALRAYRSDAPWDCSLDEWLRSDAARVPDYALRLLTVAPSTGLLEAAARMRELSGSDFASRHLVVNEPGHAQGAAAPADAGAKFSNGSAAVAAPAEGATLGTAQTPSAASAAPSTAASVGATSEAARISAPPRSSVAPSVRGILSALDVARAVCFTTFGPEIAGQLAGSTVAELMKPRDALPRCADSSTMEEALDRMLTCQQNCVLVTDAEDRNCLFGVVTTRDALMAFSEGIPLNVAVGHWMFCFGSCVSPRLVEADVPLVGAAAKMSHGCLHHLVVVAPGSEEVLGVISSSDIARAIGRLAASDGGGGWRPPPLAPSAL